MKFKKLRYFWCWRCRTKTIKAATKWTCARGHRMRSSANMTRFFNVTKDYPNPKPVITNVRPEGY